MWADSETLLSENFASVTNGNNTNTSGSSTSWNGNENFPSSGNSKAYQAGSAIKVGASGSGGYITSKSLSVKAGTLTVSFDVKGWTSVEGDIKVTVGSQNQTVSYTATISSGSFESKSVSFTIASSESMTVKLESTVKRAFLDNIVVTNTYTSDTSTPSITADNVNLEFDDTAGSISYTLNNGVEGGVLTAALTAASDWLTVGDVSASAVALTTTQNNTGAERSATVRLTYTYDTDKLVTKNVTVTQSKAVYSYTLAKTVVPGRHYIIVGKSGDNYKAMGMQNTNNRAAVSVTPKNGTITSVDGVFEFLIEVDNNAYFTIYDEDNKGYLYAAGATSNNYLKNQSTNDANGQWKISFNDEGVATIKANMNGRNLMRYNSSSTIFSCYSSGQNDIYLYERVGDTGFQNFNLTINISDACTDGMNYYGTFSAPFAFTVPSDVTVSEIGVNDDKLQVSEYTAGDVIPANTGVMISSATAGSKTFASAVGGSSVLGSSNCLRPTHFGITNTEMSNTDDGCVFYRANS